MIILNNDKRGYGGGRIAKAAQNPMTEALAELRSFLDETEPDIARILYNNWQSQGSAITYKTLREALVYAVEHNGVDGLLLWYTLYEDWQRDYNKFVKTTLAPAWEKAMDEANIKNERDINERVRAANASSRSNGDEQIKPWRWNGAQEGVRQWAQTRAAAFVTNSTETQIEAVREVVKRAAVMGTYDVDTLAQIIRPTVGLTYRDSVACTNYLKTLGEKGVKPSVAADRVHRYAQRKHKVRAEVIARTELAFSYNHGQYIGAVEAYKDGYLGEFEKVWSTADDERVCPVCGGLDGTAIGMYADFPGIQTKLTDVDVKKCPPAHPRCRCGFYIREAASPRIPKLGDVLDGRTVIETEL